jgi:hypothetical protein
MLNLADAPDCVDRVPRGVAVGTSCIRCHASLRAVYPLSTLTSPEDNCYWPRLVTDVSHVGLLEPAHPSPSTDELMSSPTERSEAPRAVIVVYHPKEGQTEALVACIRDHLPVLRSEGLATNRPALVLRAASGAFVEIFEWCSDKAIEEAHQNPAVLALWERFGACCEYIPLASLPEAHQPFSSYTPVTFGSDRAAV